MSLSDSTYQRDLGDGLLLRWSRPADIDGLATLFSTVFRDEAEHPQNMLMDAWIRHMGSGAHLLTSADNFPLVEDTRSGLIAAASGFLSATWSYDGIPFTIGRPEPVATHPDYRRRGLVRAVVELLHARSSARSDLVQAITGIPYFYRQFGYEYALALSAARLVYFSAIPQLKPGAPELYRLRPATRDELPLVMALHERELNKAYDEPLLLRAHFSEEYWQATFEDTDPPNGGGWQSLLIADATDVPVGYVLRQRLRWTNALGVFGIYTQPGTSLAAVLPAVLRTLRDSVGDVPTFRHDTPPATHIRFFLGQGHALHSLLGDVLASPQQLPYAWYIRVPDLPRFLLHIAPALERRLEGSALAGHSGELRLTFYQGGVRLAFEQGRLTLAEPWQEPEWTPKPQAGFPPLVFLQLLFGYHSLNELRQAFPDVWADDEGRVLLETLFPRRRSWVLEQG